MTGKMKKKILFLAPSLAIGGAERVLVNLLKKIDTDRYDITLCLFSNHGVYFSEIPKEIKIISIFKNHQFSRAVAFLQRKFNNTFLMKIAVRNAIKDNYDVGICFSDGLLTDTLLMASNHFLKKVAWVHSCYKTQKSLYNVYTPDKCKSLNESRYKNIDRMVFVSEHSKNEFEMLFGKKTGDVCIYNQFDFKHMKEKAEEYQPDLKKGVLNFVALGRLVAVKEFGRLVKASKILKEKGYDFHVNIIGDGPLKENLEMQISQENLDDTVSLLGFMDNPYPYIKGSDVLVLTSSSEALPTVLVEAMAFSKPIIATKCPGCIEITDGGRYGLLTEHDVEDIAIKMENVITDKDLRKRLSDLSETRVAFFDEKKTISDVYDLLDNL